MYRVFLRTASMALYRGRGDSEIWIVRVYGQLWLGFRKLRFLQVTAELGRDQ